MRAQRGAPRRPSGDGCPPPLQRAATCRRCCGCRGAPSLQQHEGRTSVSFIPPPKCLASLCMVTSGPLNTDGSFMSFQTYRFIALPWYLSMANWSDQKDWMLGSMKSSQEELPVFGVRVGLEFRSCEPGQQWPS